MTVNGSETMTIRNIENLGHKVDNRLKKVICTETGERWVSAEVCGREKGVHPDVIRKVCNPNCRLQTYKGLHYSYAENVSEVQSRLTSEIAKRNERLAELERKAALWDAQEAEKEAVRKAEEEAAAAFAKAEATYERRKRIHERKMEEARKAYARMMEAKNVLEGLQVA